MKKITLFIWIVLMLKSASGIAEAKACGNSPDGTKGPDVIDASYDPPTTDCADFVNAMEGDDTVYALGGDDFVRGGPGDDVLFGGDGNDRLAGEEGKDILHGEAGDDNLKGGEEDDQCFGGPGDDVIVGFGNNDYLDGGAGSNSVDGIDGNDVLVGRSGADVLIGNSGDDFFLIVGNTVDGYDINGDRGGGNIGSDLLFFVREATPEIVVIPPGSKYQEIRLDLRTTLPVVIDLADTPNVDAVVTGDGADHLIGTDLSGHETYKDRLAPLVVDELFISGAGDDRIETLAGDDYVDAGPGNDTIEFGAGAYYVETGSGKDLLRWDAALWQGGTVSTVVDFAVGDRILLQGAANLGRVGFSASEDDGIPVTAVSLDGVERIRLRWVAPETARGKVLGDDIEIRVLGSLQAPRTDGLPLWSRSSGGGSEGRSR